MKKLTQKEKNILENLTQREKVFYNFLWNRFIKKNPDEYTKITDLSYPLFTGYETNSRFSEIKKVLKDKILERKSKGVNYWEYKFVNDEMYEWNIGGFISHYIDYWEEGPVKKSILKASEIFIEIWGSEL